MPETGESPSVGQTIIDRARSLFPKRTPSADEVAKFKADAALNIPHNLHAGEPMPGEGAVRVPEDDLVVQEAKDIVPPHTPFRPDRAAIQPGEETVDPKTLAEDIALMDERYAEQGRPTEVSDAQSLVVKNVDSVPQAPQAPQAKQS